MFLNKYLRILVVSLLIFSMNAMEKPNTGGIKKKELILLYEWRSKEKPQNLLLQTAKYIYGLIKNDGEINITILPAELREQIDNVQVIEESTLSKIEKKWAYYIIDNNLIPTDLLIQNLKEKNFEPKTISISIYWDQRGPMPCEVKLPASFKDIIGLLNNKFVKINMDALSLYLFCSIADNKLTLVQLLILSGVNISNLKSITGYRPVNGISIFDIACLSSKCGAQTLKYIINIAQKNKLNLKELIKKECILKGLAINDPDKIRCLLSLTEHLNININEKIGSYSKQYTPLMLSIILGYDNAVKLLLENRANHDHYSSEAFSKEFGCDFSSILNVALSINPNSISGSSSNEQILITIGFMINQKRYPQNYLQQKLNIINTLKDSFPNLIDSMTELIDHYVTQFNQLIELDQTQKAIDLSLEK